MQRRLHHSLSLAGVLQVTLCTQWQQEQTSPAALWTCTPARQMAKQWHGLRQTHAHTSLR